MRIRAGIYALCGLAVFAIPVAHAMFPSEPQIASADLVSPTDRYGHDVLGGNEYSELWIKYHPGGKGEVDLKVVTLPEDRVFEDVKARIADVTGDGFPEVVVVESSRSGGAELAIYGVGKTIQVVRRVKQFKPKDLKKIAATPPIGRRNRWLAPAGIADFDGDGQNDIAYVETPHIGGTLRIWTMRGGKLVQIASKRGFSNHRIGEDFITGGVRDCGQGPELVLPNFDWSGLMVARLTGGELTVTEIGNRVGPNAVSAALACTK